MSDGRSTSNIKRIASSASASATVVLVALLLLLLALCLLLSGLLAVLLLVALVDLLSVGVHIAGVGGGGTINRGRPPAAQTPGPVTVAATVMTKVLKARCRRCQHV